jgi:hypothetical protein
MVSKRNPILAKNKISRSRNKPTGRAREPRVLPEKELEDRVLQVLEKQHEQGLTCGELSKKCRSDWRRGLAIKLRIKRVEAGLRDVQSFIYDLWMRGLVFSEPPGRGKVASRFWFLDTAKDRFPLLCPGSSSQSSSVGPLSKDQLKGAYDKFVPQHLGGFVPIFKVRRELAAPKEDFDKLLRGLNERDNPILELLGGDPQKYTEDQKKDSFWRGDNLFLRMRWRET